MKTIHKCIRYILLSGFIYVVSATECDNLKSDCSSANTTTQETLSCLSESLGSWDTCLNKTYSALRKKLTKEGCEKLKNSQLKWIAFRDAEVGFLENTYSKMQGTIYKVYLLKNKLDLTKNRCQQLQKYLEEVSEDEGDL